MKILVLYRELADYMVNCLNQAQGTFHFTVIHYPVHAEAPFQFNWKDDIIHNEKNSSVLKNLNLKEYNAVLISGWADKEYMALIKDYAGIKILMFDTPWENQFRQFIGSFYFRSKLKNRFNFAFVPGDSQKKMASKIGFSSSHIRTGLYTASDEIEAVAEKDYSTKTLWCVSRYVPQKNLHFLWTCFLKSKGIALGWKLHCAGTGIEWGQRVLNDNIIHHGFLQPKELNSELNKASAFVLPSTYEPWGVVVHECAKKALPLILSTSIHSHFQFLSEGENGYAFNPKNESDLIQALNGLFEKSESQLAQMGHVSSEKSKEISVQNWINNLTYFLTSGNVRN
ncbi:MAG: glycosyltransferase [Bacteroidetes bacterium]|nr:glycosyltransferase [Bacteroidota bacterium]